MSKCEICGCDDNEVLIIHHADGDHKNNERNNKMTVCANCHLKLHHRHFQKDANLKKEIFDSIRYEEEIDKLRIRDLKVNQWLRKQGLA